MTTHLFESIAEVANQGKARLLAGSSDLAKWDYTLNRKSTTSRARAEVERKGGRQSAAQMRDEGGAQLPGNGVRSCRTRCGWRFSDASMIRRASPTATGRTANTSVQGYTAAVSADNG